ncbi:hypothetical protein EON67_08665 [archaeon]|nr:MAG: hypothetical protein EON67_08665 [archaeon]
MSLGEQQCHIALFGLPDDFAQKRLWKRVRKLAATGCHFPFTLHGGQHVKCAILDFDRKVRTHARACAWMRVCLRTCACLHTRRAPTPPTHTRCRSAATVRSPSWTSTSCKATPSLPFWEKTFCRLARYERACACECKRTPRNAHPLPRTRAFGHVCVTAVQSSYISLKHEADKLVVFDLETPSGALLFVFNFHATNSYPDYRIGAPRAGWYAHFLRRSHARTLSTCVTPWRDRMLLDPPRRLAAGQSRWTQIGLSTVATVAWHGTASTTPTRMATMTARTASRCTRPLALHKCIV